METTQAVLGDAGRSSTETLPMANMKAPIAPAILLLLMSYAASYFVMSKPDMLYACAFPTTLNFRKPNYRIDHPAVHVFYQAANYVDQTLRPKHWQWCDPVPDLPFDTELTVNALEKLLSEPSGSTVPDSDLGFGRLEDQLVEELDALQ